MTAQLEGRHSTRLASTLDLVPTLLDVAQIMAPAQSEGLDLLALEAGRAPDTPPGGIALNTSSTPQANRQPEAPRRAVITEMEHRAAIVGNDGSAWMLDGLAAGSPRLLHAIEACTQPKPPTPPTWGQWTPGKQGTATLSPTHDTGSFATLRATLIAQQRKSRINLATSRKNQLDPSLEESLRKHGTW